MWEREAVLDLANKVIDVVGQTGKIKPKFVTNKRIDIKHRCPEVSKMKKILDFCPTVSLEDGLLQTVAYYEMLRTKPKNKK